MPLQISVDIEFNFATARLSYTSDYSNAEITQSTMIFTAMTQNHGDSRKSRHTTGKSHVPR